jgi:hypothetical protein
MNTTISADLTAQIRAAALDRTQDPITKVREAADALSRTLTLMNAFEVDTRSAAQIKAWNGWQDAESRFYRARDLHLENAHVTYLEARAALAKRTYQIAMGYIPDEFDPTAKRAPVPKPLRVR